jgi:hypothetical protein
LEAEQRDEVDAQALPSRTKSHRNEPPGSPNLTLSVVRSAGSVTSSLKALQVRVIV